MRWLVKHSTTLGLLATCIFYLIVGWIVTFHAHFFIGDNLARIANAYYILFSRDPHLAAIGFVWLPLPSLLELPVIVLLKPLGLVVYSGAVVTALFSAANVALLKRILNQLEITGRSCLALVAIYAVNPFVIMYAANGMSEAMFMTTVLLLISSMVAWRDTQRPGPLLTAGIACGLAWGMRYEAAALVAAGVTVIGSVWWLRDRTNYDRLEGEELAFVVPFAYSAGLWMFASWLITGSPLYFIHGASNTATQSLQQLRYAGSPVAPLYHHVFPALGYVLERALWFMPAFLPFTVIVAAICLFKRQPLVLVPLMFPASILLFHAYLLYELQSYGEFRYYFYALPLGILAAAMILRRIPREGSGRRRINSKIAVTSVLLATALSFPSTLHAMNTAAVGRQERPLLKILQGQSSRATETAQWKEDQLISSYIDQLHLKDGSVIADTSVAFAVVLFSNHPRQYIIPSDSDFESTVAQLPAFPGYVLISSRKQLASPLRARFPALMTNTASWAHLRERLGPWLLYKIDSST